VNAFDWVVSGIGAIVVIVFVGAYLLTNGFRNMD
jgi:hypothetical protein